MSRARRALVAAAVVAVVAVPLGTALTDPHLAPGPPALVISTAAAALAVSALTVQPFLARGGRISWHRALGGLALVLVLVHVGGLFAVEVDDTLFALSPDGPTRARMAVLATIALIGLVALGIGHGRLPLSGPSWRVVHAYLAAPVILLGFGHALLTDGALDGPGTIVLVALAAAGLAAVPAAFVARPRRARARER